MIHIYKDNKGVIKNLKNANLQIPIFEFPRIPNNF